MHIYIIIRDSISILAQMPKVLSMFLPPERIFPVCFPCARQAMCLASSSNRSLPSYTEKKYWDYFYNITRKYGHALLWHSNTTTHSLRLRFIESLIKKLFSNIAWPAIRCIHFQIKPTKIRLSFDLYRTPRFKHTRITWNKM